VPLSGPAVALLADIEPVVDRIFPIGKNSMLTVVRSLVLGCTVHGFRSTFVDWAAEQTDHAREVRESGLAHAISSATEAAYRRGALLDKRRQLMSDWAEFVGKV
jgi:integrase